MHSKMFSPATVAIVASALLSSVNGHLFIQEPVPIPGSAPKDPLDASGSNFPCHGVAFPGSGGQSMPAGSTQKLSFALDGGVNTAVHGGGSCQLSVTYETDPTKIKDPANWRVIHSIEGGCPTNTFQNLDGSYQGPQGTYSGAIPCGDPRSNGVDCVNSFNFQIPKEMLSGQATLAWTWFNNVGNREIYMNCAAVDITGGSSDASFYNSLPQMFVANLESVNSCPTTESVAVKFPFPGTSVETKAADPVFGALSSYQTFPIELPSGAGCNDNSGGNAAAPKPNQPPSPTTTPSGGVFAPGKPTSTSFTTQVVTTSAPSIGGGGSGAAPPTTGGDCVPCTSEGQIMCIGADKWGMCSNGCAVPMALAAGTSCSNGQISRREAKSSNMARRHPHGFHHRRRVITGGSF